MECPDHDRLSSTALDHAQHPHNVGALKDFNGHARITGPCGDTMEFWLSVVDGAVDSASFITDGCGSSLACGSMTTVLATGRSVEDATALRQQDILHALGGLPPDTEHCATLAAMTLAAACEDYRQGRPTVTPDAGSAGGTSCDTCGDAACGATERRKDENDEEFESRRALQSRLCHIRRKIVVLSGKGGVGKSTVAVNLATALMLSGKRVGLLDIDMHGPSIPTMLGLERETIHSSVDGLLPIELGDMKIMSLGFMLRSPDDAVIWRGPVKMGVIKQFLKDVAWGELDYLIIDSPPGTGDEPLSVCQLIDTLDGAVIVTTPQKVAAVDVRKSITFCRQLHVPVLGVIENMSGFACPNCGEVTQILPSGGGKRIAEDMGVPFLGSIPMDPKIAAACDDGRVFIHHYAATPTAEIMRNLIGPITALDERMVSTTSSGTSTSTSKENTHMKIAIPLADGKLTMHFGHCGQFALVDVHPEEKRMVKREDIEAPPHEPGLLPSWLAARGVTVIIAGGMGQRAQGLFEQHGIHVIIGAPADTPERLVSDYLAGTLQSGENVCDH